MRRIRRFRVATLVALATPFATLGCAQSPLEPRDAVAQTPPQEGAEARSQISDSEIPSFRGPVARVLALREQLGLTEAQAGEIQGILDELEVSNAPLFEQLRPVDGERRRRTDDASRSLFEQIRANTRAARERIQGVLTDEQQARLSELRPERRGPQDRLDRRAERGGRGPGFPRGWGFDLLRLRETLSLTEDQVTRLRAMRDELASANRALIEELRQSGERPFGRRGDAAENPLLQQLRSNTSAALEEMLGVLTDAQRSTLDELRQNRLQGLPQDRPQYRPRGGHRPGGAGG